MPGALESLLSRRLNWPTWPRTSTGRPSFGRWLTRVRATTKSPRFSSRSPSVSMRSASFLRQVASLTWHGWRPRSDEVAGIAGGWQQGRGPSHRSEEFESMPSNRSPLN